MLALLCRGTRSLFPCKRSVYHYLERPQRTKHTAYQVLIFCFVVFIFGLSHFVTSATEPAENNLLNWIRHILFSCDWILLSVLICELVLRLWVLEVDPAFQGTFGRLKYLITWRSWTDTLVLSATSVLIANYYFPMESTVENLRFMQFLRVLHVDRHASAWRVMRRVIVLHRTELLASFYFCIIGILFLGTTVYHIEKAVASNSSSFKDYGDALYWSVTTATTIGYGDMTVCSWWSKLMTAIFCFFLVSLTSIHSSVLGVGLACMIQDKELKKKQKKQRPCAAEVLQTWWRLHLLSTRFENIPVYRYEMLQKLLAHEMSQSISRMRGGFVDNMKARFGTLSSLNTVLQRATQKFTLKDQRNKGQKISGSTAFSSLFVKGTSKFKKDIKWNATCVDLMTDPESLIALYRKRNSCDGFLDRNIEEPPKEAFSEFDSTVHISNYHKIILRAIWTWKFFNAKRKFKRARQNCDLYDASQQLSESESIQLQEMNRLLNRLEMIFGKSSSLTLSIPSAPAETDLLSRLSKLEGRVVYLNVLMDTLTKSSRKLCGVVNGYSNQR